MSGLYEKAIIRSAFVVCTVPAVMCLSSGCVAKGGRNRERGVVLGLQKVQVESPVSGFSSGR